MTLNKLNRLNNNVHERGGAIGTANEWGNPGIFNLRSKDYVSAGGGGPTVVWSQSTTGGVGMDFSAEDVAVGDVLILGATGGFGTAPPAWLTSQGGDFTEIYDTGNSKMSVTVGYLEITSGNIATITSTPSVNTKGNQVLFGVRGVDTTTLGSITNAYSNSSIPVDPPSITNPADGSIVCVFGQEQRSNVNPTPPSGYTMIESLEHTAGGNIHSTHAAYAIVAGTGTEDPGAFGGSSGGTQARSLTFALEPL